jgi:hypothetical protein
LSSVELYDTNDKPVTADQEFGVCQNLALGRFAISLDSNGFNGVRSIFTAPPLQREWL